MDKVRLAVFISGRGSNLKALIEACAQPDYPVEIVLVVSDRDAPGLQYAREARIQIFVTHHYTNRQEFAQTVEPILNTMGVQLIALAGFMRILDADFVTRLERRILNIHPSLLPSFPGLHPHRQALEAGVKISGCTVHYVVPEVDAGPIIAQESVPVSSRDTEARLSERILQIEHQLYPRALKKVVQNLIYDDYVNKMRMYDPSTDKDDFIQ